MIRISLIFAILSILSLGTGVVFAGEPVVLDAEYHKIQSIQLGEERTIAVYRPDGYEDVLGVPVLYVLGGIEPNRIAWSATAAEWLESEGKIPPLLIVAVDHVNTRRDYSPEPDRDRPEDGQAANFLKFLLAELKPFVAERYKTVDYDILAGFSASGLFAAYAFLEHTVAFDAYILSSPMIGSAQENIFRATHRKLGTGAEFSGRVYITYARNDRYGAVTGAMPKWLDMLEKGSRPGFDWKADVLDEGGHIPYLSIYNGLTYSFPGWEYPDNRFDSTGLTDLVSFYANLSETYGFAIRVPVGLLIRLGQNCLRRADYDQALPVFDLAARDYPEGATIHYLRGESFRYLGRKPEARECYQTALQLDSTFQQAQRALKALGND